MDLKSLLDLLDSIGEEVTLVVEQRLIGLLSASCPYSTLKKSGVQRIVTLPVNPPNAAIAASTFLILTTALPSSLNDINAFAKANLGSRLIVALMAAETPDVIRSFSKAGILGDVEIETIPFSFVSEVGMPGLSTLHLSEPISKSNVNVDGEWLIAKALYRDQCLQGGFARVSGFGSAATRVFNYMKALDSEQYIASQLKDGDSFHYRFSHTFYGGQGIDHLILIDRKVDRATPMLMQATYAGVLSEIFSITPAGIVETEAKKFGVRDDPLYGRIASLNFADACQQIHTTAKEVQADVNRRSEVGESLDELRRFIANLGSLKETERLINTHVELAGEAMRRYTERAQTSQIYDLQSRILSGSLSAQQTIAEISDLIYQNVDLKVVLRLVSLLCLARGGIRERQLQTLFDEIARSYGPMAIVQIQGMQKKDYIFTSSSSPGYTSLDKTWSLFTSEEQDMAASSYAGIVPLSSRLASALISKSPSDSAAIAHSLSSTGQNIDFFDEVTASDSAREAKLRRILLRNTPGHAKPVVVIAFIGGVTYAEAAATHIAVIASAKKHQGRDIDVRVFGTGLVQ